MRRDISLSRVIAPIFGERVQIRTFHHDRVVVVDGVRPAFTLDQVVTLTMPLIAFQHPHGIACRRIDL